MVHILTNAPHCVPSQSGKHSWQAELGCFQRWLRIALSVHSTHLWALFGGHTGLLLYHSYIPRHWEDCTDGQSADGISRLLTIGSKSQNIESRSGRRSSIGRRRPLNPPASAFTVMNAPDSFTFNMHVLNSFGYAAVQQATATCTSQGDIIEQSSMISQLTMATQSARNYVQPSLFSTCIEITVHVALVEASA